MGTTTNGVAHLLCSTLLIIPFSTISSNLASTLGLNAIGIGLALKNLGTTTSLLNFNSARAVEHLPKSSWNNLLLLSSIRTISLLISILGICLTL
ncbi:unnamed protein product [Haemonchus placei]|uniref:Uncharacterized protein n=1 Tax=Haemonchus placei TaxID=6290 RepID=A0A3P7UM77_HAEPC|nr:unnamed protein product [Haemonchus placei]